MTRGRSGDNYGSRFAGSKVEVQLRTNHGFIPTLTREERYKQTWQTMKEMPMTKATTLPTLIMAYLVEGRRYRRRYQVLIDWRHLGMKNNVAGVGIRLYRTIPLFVCIY